MENNIHIIKEFFLWFILTFSFITVLKGQTSFQEIYENPEKSGGVQYVYPERHVGPAAPYPEGFYPFYISHFGRHGSRYLVEDDEYKQILDIFKVADQSNNLTSTGKDVYERLKVIWEESAGKGGELTPLGIAQQKAIATRMFTRYTQVFGDGNKITGVSTTVPRCIHSMEYYCGKLAELNPRLNISLDAEPEHMEYLNFHTDEAIRFRSGPGWKIRYNEFQKKNIHPERLMAALFTNTVALPENENPVTFMLQLFNIASNLQNMETDITLYDLFEKKELFSLWQCRNYRLYVQYANAAENGGIMMENAKPLLKNIVETANLYIESNLSGATLRFGHDGNIVPLSMLLHLENCYNSVSEPEDFYKAWSDFTVAPMGANIQMVFFKKKGSKDILVKFLQNEVEVKVPPIKSYAFPYYLWSDVMEYYLKLLN